MIYKTLSFISLYFFITSLTCQLYGIRVLGIRVKSRQDFFAHQIKLGLPLSIKLALKNNREIHFERLEFDLAKNDWLAAQEEFFLPSIDLSYSTDFGRTAYIFNEDYKTEEDSFQPTYPSSSISLNIGSFNLWNWGRDWSDYRSRHRSYQMALINHKKFILDMKFQVIMSYFNLKRDVDSFEDAWKDFTQAHKYLQIMKEKALLDNSLYDEMKRVELDVAKHALSIKTSISDFLQSQRDFRGLLGVNNEVNYIPIDDIPFTRLKAKLSDILRIAEKSSPELKYAQFSLEDSKTEYHNQRMSLLPLPVITFNGLTFSIDDVIPGDMGSERNIERPYKLDMSISAGMSIPLVGGDGFFNYRSIKSSSLSLQRSRTEFTKSLTDLRLRIKSLYKSIKNIEEHISLSSVVLIQSLKFLTDSASKYSQREISFQELKDISSEVKDTQQNYRASKTELLMLRIELATLLGIDKLPGSNPKSPLP